ncbi:hypothetical protein GCM10010446_01000 [Streptomyces enissocaesilis]|uniref:Uncharacterized protein n=1 Tax=Streptomyces enissocaesilis TaxID=332589 RepID=A0ABN3WMW1_9ACTN
MRVEIVTVPVEFHGIGRSPTVGNVAIKLVDGQSRRKVGRICLGMTLSGILQLLRWVSPRRGSEGVGTGR